MATLIERRRAIGDNIAYHDDSFQMSLRRYRLLELEISLLLTYALAYADFEALMTDHRHVRLFRDGRNQAVRIPVEFELPGDEAIMHRDGRRLVIEAVQKRGLLALLDSMEPFTEPFPDVDNDLLQLRDVKI